MIKTIIKKLFSREVISYLIAGVLTTVVNFIVYAIFIKIFGGAENGQNIHIIAWDLNSVIIYTNIIAWIVAVLFAYFTNRYFVFSNRAVGFKASFIEFWKFIGSRIATGIIEMFGPALLFGIGIDFALFGIDGIVAKGIISVIIIILNYVFSKFFVFNSKKDKKGQA